ncbi:hypothetical protein HanXRQr2_Chr16g0734781 [Helianthus annuus]|uniref:Uncharacterized protein n=1 Tax=Helianthus annuus TaxID=4232 RepID=A0A9K3DPM7_HELAN|nr:hypothetical protein HanXRQr2_Chr16g0734781 [Helianthus annuus]
MNSPEYSCAKLANYDFDDVVSKTWLASIIVPLYQISNVVTPKMLTESTGSTELTGSTR